MSTRRTVVLAGGGTGGHIYPLLAIAAELRARQPETVIRFAGEVGRMEADLVPRAGYPLDLLVLPPANAPKWRRVLGAGRWVTGYLAAKRLLQSIRPQVVVGSGGQICAPVLFAASRLGIPRVVLEPNAVPGQANLLLARHAHPDLIGLGIPKAAEYFPAGARIELTGYPLRPAILSATRQDSATRLGLDPTRRTLLVTGGSLGSGKLNESLVSLLPDLHEPWAEGLQILHLGGWVNARTLLPEQMSNLTVSYVYREYLHEMEDALAAADLVLGRAGATALAELTARGLPALLVPLQAVDHHQELNAAWMAEAGAAVVVDDAELTAERLGTELGALLGRPDRLVDMAAASRGLGQPQAAATVVGYLEELAGW